MVRGTSQARISYAGVKATSSANNLAKAGPILRAEESVGVSPARGGSSRDRSRSQCSSMKLRRTIQESNEVGARDGAIGPIHRKMLLAMIETMLVELTAPYVEQQRQGIFRGSLGPHERGAQLAGQLTTVAGCGEFNSVRGWLPPIHRDQVGRRSNTSLLIGVSPRWGKAISYR